MNSREAFEEWVEKQRDSYDPFDVWQASRKQLLKELREKEPDAYVTTEGLQLAPFGESPVPLIIRPTEEE